nr:RecName: Full=Putative 18 kDa spermidine-binding protein [Zea mays]
DDSMEEVVTVFIRTGSSLKA